MGFTSSLARWLSLGVVGLALCGVARPALAAPKPKPHAAVQRKPTQKNLKRPDPDADRPDSDGKDADAPGADDKAAADKGDRPDKAESSSPKSAGPGRSAPTPAGAATVKEDKQGVKTYKFGTVEVEGRMKSPQIIYFLRRVRAEFDAGLLGHRTFMRELSDTRNQSALR